MESLTRFRNRLTKQAGMAHEKGDMKEAKIFLEVSRDVEVAMRNEIARLHPFIVEVYGRVLTDLKTCLAKRHISGWDFAHEGEQPGYDRFISHQTARMFIEDLRMLRKYMRFIPTIYDLQQGLKNH